MEKKHKAVIFNAYKADDGIIVCANSMAEAIELYKEYDGDEPTELALISDQAVCKIADENDIKESWDD